MIRHLYVHIPFCHKICPYCAFYKHQPGETRMADFVTALLDEARAANDRWPLKFQTIYFGGGTPTLLSRSLLERLIMGMREIFDLSDLAEWTFEANPKTFDQDKVECLHRLGVTRMSLGVQSWTPRFLDLLGRDHSPTEARESYQMLRAVGFDVVNLDLMFSLPGQTLAEWENELDITLALDPDHISAYNLTYEEDTAFFEQLGQGAYNDDMDVNASHFYRADERLRESGYEHYEISNYAKSEKRSLHNQAYWAGNDYLGLGPSAVSTIFKQRWKNLPNTAIYTTLAQANPDKLRMEIEDLSDQDLHNERIALLLRTSKGIPFISLDTSVRDRAQDFIDEAILSRSGEFLRLNRDHLAMVDSVAAELML